MLERASDLTASKKGFKSSCYSIPQAEPIPITSAPAFNSSAACSPLAIPPIPIIGTSLPTAFRILVIHSTARSNTQAPLFPPFPPSLFCKTGLPEFGSMCIFGPVVLIAEIPSAPARITSLAISPILSTFAVNLTKIGVSQFGSALRIF